MRIPAALLKKLLLLPRLLVWFALILLFARLELLTTTRQRPRFCWFKPKASARVSANSLDQFDFVQQKNSTQIRLIFQAKKWQRIVKTEKTSRLCEKLSDCDSGDCRNNFCHVRKTDFELMQKFSLSKIDAFFAIKNNWENKNDRKFQQINLEELFAGFSFQPSEISLNYVRTDYFVTESLELEISAVAAGEKTAEAGETATTFSAVDVRLGCLERVARVDWRFSLLLLALLLLAGQLTSLFKFNC